MELISWTDNLSVGVATFDAEHKKLINYVNELNQALSIGSTQKTMEDILTNLVNYTVIHFNHEEDYMKIHDYPGYADHHKEHEELKAQVSDFNNRLKSGKASFSLELMMFLKNWLAQHIMGSDMQYKDFFIGKGAR
jgi:hemerythrin-like metal-binding protein